MRLGEVASYVGGITFKPEDTVGVGDPDSVVCMRTKNVQAELDTRDLIAVPRSFVRREDQFLRAGDILVSSANSWNLVGKCCYVPELGYAAALGGFISLLRPNRAVVEPTYLYRWLAWDETQSVVRGLARQTTNIANLPRERFLDLDVPLPPLPEQRRVAAILDEADALRRKRREALALLDDLLRATFLDMFGDPMTNPRGWESAPAGSLITDSQYGTTEKANTDGIGLPVLRMNNLTYEGRWLLDDLKHVEIPDADFDKLTVRPGDLLFNRTNSPELVGKTGVWRSAATFAFAGYLIRFRFDETRLLPDYVSGYLNSSSGKQYLFGRAKASNNMSNFSASMFAEIPLQVPPLQLQRRFAATHAAIEAERTRHESALAAADSLFTSLLSRAFSGEL